MLQVLEHGGILLHLKELIAETIQRDREGKLRNLDFVLIPCKRLRSLGTNGRNDYYLEVFETNFLQIAQKFYQVIFIVVLFPCC